MTINGKEIVALDVPEGAKHFSILVDEGESFLEFVINGHVSGRHIAEGTWSILGRAKDITEEVARGLVENYFGDTVVWGSYKNYITNIMECRSATESFLSWCKANGITDEVLLIKQ